VSLGDEVQRAELLDELALDRARVVPVESVERLEGADRGRLRSRGEVTLIALAAGDRDQLFEGRPRAARRRSSQSTASAPGSWVPRAMASRAASPRISTP
jgi:hypothetical protein